MTLSPPSLQSFSAGLLASIVGTASSFAVVVQGLLEPASRARPQIEPGGPSPEGSSVVDYRMA